MKRTYKTKLKTGFYSAWAAVGLYSALAVFLDRVSKYLAATFLEIESNAGIAFSIKIPQAILIPLICLFIIAAVYLAETHLNLRRLPAQILTGMVLGGALGNLIDRILYGHVMDFIAVWKWPIFNIADTFITVGMFCVIIFYGKLKKINKPQK